MNKDERKHYDNVARLGCSLCRHLGNEGTPAELHHIRSNGGLRKNAPVIPLCPEHHRGNTGVHGLGKKQFASRYGVDEQSLLRQTLELLDTEFSV